MLTGNNATAMQARKLSALWRGTDETFRTLSSESTLNGIFEKSLGGEQPDYELNRLLRAGANPDLRRL